MRWRYALFLVIVLAGVLLRVVQLDLRPMHVDEAVHAIKFGDLIERGEYRYDPVEYHGPTLNYFTLIPAYLASETTLARLHEPTLRIVPVFFGVLLILLLLLLDEAASPFVLVAALLTAVSPAMVFYSRYYIQEVLLVCFSFGVIACGIRYLHRPRATWAVLAGLFLGLMHATKETSAIAVGAMGIAAIGGWMLRPRGESPAVHVAPRHLVAALAAAALTSIVFFSSFFTNWQGIPDSIATYGNYFSKAGANTLHRHPWHYYLQILSFFQLQGGPIWSEGIILLLGALGIVMTFPRWDTSRGLQRDVGRFLALYALAMMIMYTVIPYKTPWSMLGFLHGLIILGALGFARLWALASRPAVRAGLIGLLVLAGSHLAWQAGLANFRYYEDPVNPYVYAHAVNDVVVMGDIVRQVAASAPEGYNLPIQVICQEDDYWPFPWYLRAFPNVGWWSAVEQGLVPTPIMLVTPELEGALLRKLYEEPAPGERHLYVPLFPSRMDLRPRKEIRGYVRHSYWERYKSVEERWNTKPPR